MEATLHIYQNYNLFKIMTDSKPNTVEWFNAVAAGSLGEVERMVNEYATSCDPQGETALMIAARGTTLNSSNFFRPTKPPAKITMERLHFMIGANLITTKS